MSGNGSKVDAEMQLYVLKAANRSRNEAFLASLH